MKHMLHRQKLDWEAYAPITLKQIDEAGVEPDVCFYNCAQISLFFGSVTQSIETFVFGGA